MRAGLVSRRGCGRAEEGWLPALCNAAVEFDQTALTAAIILLVVCPLVYFSFAVCCGRRTRKVENDDLNRRASAMSIELVRRRSSINYDNLPVNRV